MNEIEIMQQAGLTLHQSKVYAALKSEWSETNRNCSEERHTEVEDTRDVVCTRESRTSQVTFGQRRGLSSRCAHQRVSYSNQEPQNSPASVWQRQGRRGLEHKRSEPDFHIRQKNQGTWANSKGQAPDKRSCSNIMRVCTH